MCGKTSGFAGPSGALLSPATTFNRGRSATTINFQLCCRLEAPEGLLASYLHTSPAPGVGRIASLVALESKGKAIPETALPKIQVSENQPCCHVEKRTHFWRHACTRGRVILLICLCVTYQSQLKHAWLCCAGFGTQAGHACGGSKAPVSLLSCF